MTEKKSQTTKPITWIKFISVIIVLLVITYTYNNRKTIFAKKITQKVIKTDSIIAADKRLMEEVSQYEKQIDRIAKEKSMPNGWEKTKAGKLLKRHPEWGYGNCEKLVDRKIWIGMSYDMLIYLRGNPNHINPSNYGKGIEWQWCWSGYTPSCFYDNNDDGIIDAYN